MGTGELRMIHSRVSWMCLPVERSITVSPPQRIAHVILSTSSAMEEPRALLPMLALIFTRKLRPITIGSVSGWLMFAGMIARPRATSARTNSPVTSSGMAAPLDPLRAQRRQPGADVDTGRRVGVGAAGVVHVHRRVRLGAEGRGRVRLRDLAHRHADVGARALEVHLARARQRLDGGVV